MKILTSLLAAALVCSLGLQVHALGLGKLAVISSVSEPLSASIPIKLNANESIDEVHVSLASQDIFEKMGIDYSHEHTKIKITLDRSKPSIIIQTKTPFNEPFIQLIVNVTTPTQQFNRSVTLLLDTPKNESAASVFKE
ncbi:MAG: hypothetical protein KAG18_02045 [Sinobacterium sp.]|nr:hypothetical protein [Sinobacterium sp.]